MKKKIADLSDPSDDEEELRVYDIFLFSSDADDNLFLPESPRRVENQVGGNSISAGSGSVVD